MNVAENVKRMREKAGFTQDQLAQSVGINKSMVCQIERGTKACSLQLGAAIAKVLGCEIQELVS